MRRCNILKKEGFCAQDHTVKASGGTYERTA